MSFASSVGRRHPELSTWLLLNQFENMHICMYVVDIEILNGMTTFGFFSNCSKLPAMDFGKATVRGELI